jgi:hypothetical protein
VHARDDKAEDEKNDEDGHFAPRLSRHHATVSPTITLSQDAGQRAREVTGTLMKLLSREYLLCVVQGVCDSL